MRRGLITGKSSAIPLFAKKRDIIICVIIAVFAAISLLLMYRASSGERLTAVISVNGEVYMTTELTDNNAGYIHLPTQPPVTLEVSNGGIRFVNALCRDKLCEKCGLLSHGGNTAACLPAKTVVTVKASGSDGPDAITY